ncbi:hypothetical protein M9458_052272, partial [Cirrhinus mrigala]
MFLEDYSLDTDDPAAPPATVQAAARATSAPQDPTTEPAATSRGHRPSRAAAAHTPRRRITPSPPPSRRQASSPASSYTSALSSAPAKGKWTVAGLRQALASAGISLPRRSTKADLLDLYASLQAGENPNSSPPSRASGRACTGHSAPYPQPGQTITPPRTASQPSGRNRRPSASLGHAPNVAVASLRPPSRSSQRELAAHAGGEPAIASTSRREVICATFPHRRRELSDYLTIVAELALSYGGSHFYTYHKLFAAKCAICVAQWNQCPYWGALDTELHSRVFSCAVCRSFSHSTVSCPFINPSIPPCPESSQPKSTSYVPRLMDTPATPAPTFRRRPSSSDSQVCTDFNSGRCTRQRCRFMHVCNFCGGAHARLVCPVQKAANKNPKQYLSTPVNVSRLSAELLHHPDSHFTDYVLSGLAHGFHPGVRSHQKILRQKRLIIDLSSPHNSPFTSINSLIPLEEFSLHYHNVDQAITLIKEAGRGAWLAKVDITSAFKVMPIHPDFWHLFGIRWKNKFYFAVHLTFGCRSSPKIFDTLSEAICWILSNNYNIPYLIHLLDDFLIISPPDSVPAAHLLTTQKLFSELGIPLAQDKTEGPSTSIEFLGINLDSQKFLASLPKEKIDRTILQPDFFPNRYPIIYRCCPLRRVRRFFQRPLVRFHIVPPAGTFATAAFILSAIRALSVSGRSLPMGQRVVRHQHYRPLRQRSYQIQIAGTRGGPAPNPSSSLFRTDIPVNHPLRPLLEASINSILQAISPRTLQSYLTAWKCFKIFHSAYSLPFPDFSLLAVTSFISHLNTNKNLQASSIKGYLSGIQFFHKLLYGSPSPHITNSQTSLLIKGIQKTQPNRPDPRQPITLKILTKCISTLRKGYHSIRTLDAMFILAFFGFLRCSELAITSGFNPAIHPTISDLAVLDGETISYFIKQSKTDQTKKGHFIYIFNLQSPIQLFQTLLAFLQLRKSQSKLPSDPLFTDNFNRPATRFWFQKHLKSVLLLSGTPADNFSSHSFRIGAATTAAQKGLSQQQIQALGRWSSEAFKSYIRSDRSLIKEAHQTL